MNPHHSVYLSRQVASSCLGPTRPTDENLDGHARATRWKRTLCPPPTSSLCLPFLSIVLFLSAPRVPFFLIAIFGRDHLIPTLVTRQRCVPCTLPLEQTALRTVYHCTKEEHATGIKILRFTQSFLASFLLPHSFFQRSFIIFFLLLQRFNTLMCSCPYSLGFLISPWDLHVSHSGGIFRLPSSAFRSITAADYY